MSLWKIVLRSVAERKLSSALTAISIALGVAVTVAILLLQRQARQAVEQDRFGCDLVVGAKGSPLQLVLNSLFHLDRSPGNISWDLYGELREDRRVALAVPIAVGDSYRGFRIVGTSRSFLADYELGPGRRFRFSQGAAFSADSTRFEAVVGATVARRTGLRAGSTFVAEHGLGDSVNAEEHEEQPWTVVGVLEPTGTPNDRAIFITIESFFAIRGHVRANEVSAVLVTLANPAHTPLMAANLNRRPDAQAAVPAQVVGSLLDTVGQVNALLLAVSALVIVVAGVSILVSIYNSMNDRRRAIAILRALGARRWTILSIVELEAMFLCVAGGLLGVLLGHALAALAAGFVRSTAGIALSPWTFAPEELAVLAGLVILGGLVGLLPALKAYRADIAAGLAPTV